MAEHAIAEVVTPGVARAGGYAPSVRVSVPAGGARAGGFAPVAVILPVLYPISGHDGWHPAADHHDLVLYGTELVAVVVFIFVGAKLVARRLLR